MACYALVEENRDEVSGWRDNE